MRILRIGSKGEDVKSLQAALGINPDGYFGPATMLALKTWQGAHKLTADGIAGPATMSALAPQPAPSPVVDARPQPKLTSLAQIDAAYEKGTIMWYQSAYLIQQVDRGYQGQVSAAADRAVKQKALYDALEHARGIPWYATALIHALECNNNPRGVLHNGQAIIGTGKRTTIVPIGRGPFSTWIQAALDAVDSMPAFHTADWSVGSILKLTEIWNGKGYLLYHRQENSPYDWGDTDINSGHGKYVADGQWDPYADTHAQVGTAAILHELEMRGLAKLTYRPV